MVELLLLLGSVNSEYCITITNEKRPPPLSMMMIQKCVGNESNLSLARAQKGITR